MQYMYDCAFIFRIYYLRKMFSKSKCKQNLAFILGNAEGEIKTIVKGRYDFIYLVPYHYHSDLGQELYLNRNKTSGI